MQKTILIFEDNALNMKMFNDLLQAHGYKTLKSINGGDVMALVKGHRPTSLSWTFSCLESLGLNSPRC